MSLNSQNGGAKISTLFSLALLAAFVWALFNVGPVFIADYNLQDEMVQVAQKPRTRSIQDSQYEKMVLDEAIELDLQDYIKLSQIKVKTKGTSREIKLKYQRTVKILPGFVHTFVFDHTVDERIL
jgi:hypothetical protein